MQGVMECISSLRDSLPYQNKVILVIVEIPIIKMWCYSVVTLYVWLLLLLAIVIIMWNINETDTTGIYQIIMIKYLNYNRYAYVVVIESIPCVVLVMFEIKCIDRYPWNELWKIWFLAFFWHKVIKTINVGFIYVSLSKMSSVRAQFHKVKFKKPEWVMNELNKNILHYEVLQGEHVDV